MSYKIGNIVLVKFPFTNLKSAKKRPVLIIKDENNLGDIVCFQITSNENQTSILKIETNDFENEVLPLNSYVKYDKCFTLGSSIIDKQIASVNRDFLDKLKTYFCKEVF